MSLPMKKDDWYQRLISECQDIIVEHSFASRWAVVEGYHTLGKRILEEHDNFERAGYGERIAARVSESLGKHPRSIERAIQFARKFPELSLLKEGKDISWHVICQKYLPAPKEDKETKAKACKYQEAIGDTIVCKKRA